MEQKKIPTPYEWAGGEAAFNHLTEVFYDKVLKDDILEPIFRHMSSEHSQHVASFLAQAFKGPEFYTSIYGTDAMRHMVSMHLGKRLTEEQRKRWLDLLLLSADEIGIPNDPEFRSVLVGHLEWGTRMAVMFSHETENPMSAEDHVPKWGWGEVGGPFGYVEPLFRK